MTKETVSERFTSRYVLAGALRHSAGLWALPALVVVELVNAFARGQEWAIEWQWTAYWSNAATSLICPLLAAVGAAESVAYRRKGVAGLLGSGSPRLRADLLRGGATGAWGLLAHLIGVAVCVAAAVRIHDSFHLQLQLLLPAVMAVLASAFVGAAVGWLWPSLAAPPIVALAGVALTSISPIGALMPYVRVHIATVGLEGLVTRPAFIAVDCMWWIVVAGAALWLLGRSGPFSWRGDGALALVVVLAVALMRWQGNEPFRLVVQAPRPACSSTRPSVCLSADYAPRLAAYTPVVGRLAAVVGDLDPGGLPSRVVQAGSVVAGSPPAEGSVAISVTPRGRPAPEDIAFQLIESVSGCPQASTAPSARLLQDEQRLVAWLVRDAGLGVAQGIPPGAELSTSAQARSVLASLRTEC
jgi:hypothetical protein